MTSLPEFYKDFLRQYPYWECEYLGRTWQLASSGNDNPLQLSDEWNIDGAVVRFDCQTLQWSKSACLSIAGGDSESSITLVDFANCLSIAEDNGDLLITNPRNNYQLNLFTLDGGTVEPLLMSISDFAEEMLAKSKAQNREAEAHCDDLSLSGKWKNTDQSLGDEILCLSPDGTAERSYDDGSLVRGTWRSSSESLQLTILDSDALPEIERYLIESRSLTSVTLFDPDNDFRESWIRIG